MALLSLLCNFGNLCAQAGNGVGGLATFRLSIVVAGPFQRWTMIRLAKGFGAAGVFLGAMVLERRGALVVPRWLVAL